MLDKSNIALICIFGMCIGFLCSTALLSITMFLFGVNGIRDIHPRYWVKNKWWLLGVAWVGMYALTYFWSADKAYWGVRLQTKLPFLILPLAIAYLPPFSTKQLQRLTLSMGVIFFYSACYSLYFFMRHPEEYMFGYKYSHLLPTLPRNDYIRASLAMVLYVAWCFYVWPLLASGWMKRVVAFLAAFLIIFVHILASKTGLLSLYLFLVGWGIYLSFGKRKTLGLLLLVAIPVFLVLAVKFIPTLRQRADYIHFSYVMLMKGDRSGNYGDVNRLMSYKIAVQLISEQPLRGVGMGNMYNAMLERYHELYPQVRKEDVLLPHNQFLVVALGCGIPAMLLFVWWVFMPLTRIRKNRQRFFFFIVWLVLLFQLMIEPVLEVQHGVYVYLFFLVLFLHEVPGKNDSSGKIAQ